MKAKHLFYTLFIFLFSLTSCENEANIDYVPTVLFNFEGGTNLVTTPKGIKEYTVKGSITSAAGLTSFVISTANAETGAAISVIESTRQTFDEPKSNYDFSYTITNLSENKAIKISVTDAEGEDFPASVKTGILSPNEWHFVEITPAVIFSEHSDKKLESVDKYWGVFYAEWLYGRIYKSREAGKYAAEVNIGMENKNGKAVLISPAKHSLTFNGARNTKFGVTNMTLEQFNAISRIDDTPLKNLSPTTESIEIENGKVYAYQTQDGQKGVVYIQNLTGNAGSTDDPTVTATIVTKLQAK